MALSEIERKRVEGAMEGFLERQRPSPEIRPKMDLGYRINGQSVAIFEIRPRWDQPSERMETPVAKVSYVRTRDIWKVYWMRGDGKWHGYEPVPTVGSIEKFLQLVEADQHACFFG